MRTVGTRSNEGLIKVVLEKRDAITRTCTAAMGPFLQANRAVPIVFVNTADLVRALSPLVRPSKGAIETPDLIN